MRKILTSMVAALAITLSAFSSPLSAQVVDEVTFTDVMPDPNGIGDLQNYTITNSGSLEALAFFGTITEIDTATFGNEITFDYNGSGLSGSGIQLTSVTGFTDTIAFQAFIPIDDGLGMPGSITAGDNWTFNFFENFDDGGDGLVDANVNVTFQYRDEVPVANETNLGDFTLDDGFYDRGGGGGPEDHPFTTVDFQVTEDGIYSIESNWDDGTGTGTIFDGFLFVFDEPFDGVDDSCSIAFDDDGTNGIANSTIDGVFLEQGITYTALLTTFGSQTSTDLQGDLIIGNSLGIGSAFLVNSVPEPGTGIVLVSISALAMMRRKRS